MGAYTHRVRRSSPEIAIAAVLTFAAIAFLIATLAASGTDTRNSKLGPVASEQMVIK